MKIENIKNNLKSIVGYKEEENKDEICAIIDNELSVKELIYATEYISKLQEISGEHNVTIKEINAGSKCNEQNNYEGKAFFLRVDCFCQHLNI